jgi:uncharacterized membrane protein
MLDSLKFLSTGIQFAMLAIFVVLVLLFMKVSSMESRIEAIEANMGECVAKDDFTEAIRAMS